MKNEFNGGGANASAMCQAQQYNAAAQQQGVQSAPVGLGMSMYDQAYRQAIAKLADDLERIKRARG